MGPVDTGDETGLVYLRPETAQGIFVNFQNVLDTMRRKLPFGIAQIGKAFRNEVTPGNFTFRTREFEQMEIEYFVKPGEDEAAHQMWIDARTRWYHDLGLRADNLMASASRPGRSWPTTPSAASTWSTASPWDFPSWKGSPTAPTST